ncbi:MAG: sigma-54 dependent transcriptional regulator [Gammaproteobacteria bacterium]|nr:sigma-54 dependent transcriptional regulator [Gammaproteobacteria bacterium]
MSDALLVIEDEKLFGTELCRNFERQGWEVDVARDLEAARSKLEILDPLVVLSDMSLPDGNAIDLLEQVRSDGNEVEWIFLTSFGSVPESVRALRLGAYDFIEKPVTQAHLDLVVAGAARSARAQRRLREESASSTRRYSAESFIGRSLEAAEVRRLLKKLARVPFSALVISGETGTGKGFTARILHHAGLRATGPIIEVNCAALPKDLLESELFGYEQGAFTGANRRHRGLMEQASGGTLFLDEISELGLDLQAKILTAIEDRIIRRLGGEQPIRIDVQLIAATNRDLGTAVSEGRFRADLYHRLNVFRLELPPLRDRKEDLDELVPVLLAEFNIKAGKDVREIPENAWLALRNHDWPGNVRELRNVIERCVLFADTAVLPFEWLQLGPGTHPASDRPGGADGLWIPLDGSMDLEEMDRLIIKTVLDQQDHNIQAAARALGTTRETLRYRIQKYRLDHPDRT